LESDIGHILKGNVNSQNQKSDLSKKSELSIKTCSVNGA